jgi:hypothetical protein
MLFVLTMLQKFAVIVFMLIGELHAKNSGRYSW